VGLSPGEVSGDDGCAERASGEDTGDVSVGFGGLFSQLTSRQQTNMIRGIFSWRMINSTRFKHCEIVATLDIP